MKYIIITILLTGCANNSQVVKLEHNNKERILPSKINNSFHRNKAQELGISYVDYLHLMNTKKTSVNKSQFKLDHAN